MFQITLSIHTSDIKRASRILAWLDAFAIMLPERTDVYMEDLEKRIEPNH